MRIISWGATPVARLFAAMTRHWSGASLSWRASPWRRPPSPWTTRRPTGASTAAPRSASRVAPATEWAASAWIGDDSTKLRLYNTGIVGDSGHIDNEGGTQGIDSRFFYSRLISDFWDAKAGVRSPCSTGA